MNPRIVRDIIEEGRGLLELPAGAENIRWNRRSGEGQNRLFAAVASNLRVRSISTLKSDSSAAAR